MASFYRLVFTLPMPLPLCRDRLFMLMHMLCVVAGVGSSGGDSAKHVVSLSVYAVGVGIGTSGSGNVGMGSSIMLGVYGGMSFSLMLDCVGGGVGIDFQNGSS